MSRLESPRPIVYDQKLFVLPANQTDYDVKTNQSSLFDNVPLAKNIVIFFDASITIRFNNTLMPAAILPISRSPFQSPSRFLDISNIFLTNTTAVNVEVWLW